MKSGFQKVSKANLTPTLVRRSHCALLAERDSLHCGGAAMQGQSLARIIDQKYSLSFVAKHYVRASVVAACSRTLHRNTYSTFFLDSFCLPKQLRLVVQNYLVSFCLPKQLCSVYSDRCRESRTMFTAVRLARSSLWLKTRLAANMSQL